MNIDAIPEINKRFINILEYYQYSGYKMEKELTGIKQVQISHIKNGRNKPSQDVIEKLLIKFPNVNYQWLLTGEGEMLLGNTENEELQQSEDVYSKEDLEDRYNGYYYPEVRVSAGFGENNIQHHKEPVIVPGIYEELEYINVFGDSMFPKFSSGDIIGIKPIDFSYLVYGHSYVIVLDNGDSYIKYVKKGSDKSHILLSSENKFYDDMEFPIARIRSLYIIKASISKQTF